jgi:hypothetical protein
MLRSCELLDPMDEFPGGTANLTPLILLLGTGAGIDFGTQTSMLSQALASVVGANANMNDATSRVYEEPEVLRDLRRWSSRRLTW